jgi:hypothetical protein
MARFGLPKTIALPMLDPAIGWRVDSSHVQKQLG